MTPGTPGRVCKFRCRGSVFAHSTEYGADGVRCRPYDPRALEYRNPPASCGVSRHMSAVTDRISRPWLVWIALWTVYIVWGSTYLAIRVSVETLPPLLAAGVRFVIAGGIMVAVLTFRRRSFPRVSRTQLFSCTVVGGALCLGGNGLVVLAERDVPSSLAALIIASVPLWVVLFRSATGDRVSKGTLAGVALGFIGVAILVLPGDRPEGANLLGLVLLIAAAMSWASGSFLSTRLELPPNPFVSTAVQQLCGGVLILVVGVAMGEPTEIDAGAWSSRSLVALLYLIVFGSLFAFTAYVWLLQNAPISRVATYAYVNPVIALLLGWLILSEEITSTMLIGACVIVASVAFIVRRETGAPRHNVYFSKSSTSDVAGLEKN
jgi:drug/metabolite transporter (DMT)-like permease